MLPLSPLARFIVQTPPVQAGMLPSALPAISAPSGVSVVPSCAACAAVTCARAGDG